MPVKNAIAKTFHLATNSDGTKNSAYPNGDKPSAVIAPTLTGPTQVNSTTLRVGISGGAGATSWTLEKSTNGGSSWTSAGSVTVGATQADATVTAGQSTQLRIAASAGGSPVYSNVVTGTASAGGELLYFENWEGTTNGGGVAGRGNSNVTWDATSSAVRASNARAVSGSMSVRFNWPANQQPNTDLQFTMAQEHDEIYVGFKLYIPENFFNSTTSNVSGQFTTNKKFFSLHSTVEGYSGYNDVILEYSANGSGGGLLDPTFQDETSLGRHLQSYLIANGLMPATPIIDYANDRGQWATFCIRVVRATTATGTGVNRRGNGIVQIWKNRQFYWGMNDYPNYSPTGRGYGDGYFIGAANGGFAVETNLYIDDITFATGASAVADYLPV